MYTRHVWLEPTLALASGTRHPSFPFTLSPGLKVDSGPGAPRSGGRSLLPSPKSSPGPGEGQLLEESGPPGLGALLNSQSESPAPFAQPAGRGAAPFNSPSLGGI